MLLKCLLFLSLAAQASFAANVGGQWFLHLIRDGEEVSPARVQLNQTNEDVTGTLNELKLSGKIHGDDIDVTATRPGGSEFGKLRGKLQNGELKGTVKMGDNEIGVGDAPYCDRK